MLYPVELRGHLAKHIARSIPMTSDVLANFTLRPSLDSLITTENPLCVVPSKTHQPSSCRSCPIPCPQQFAPARVRRTRATCWPATPPSPLGQRRIAELHPSLDRAWIETQQQLTAEIREYRRVGGRFEFAGLPEVRKLIEKSRIAGAALETTEIRDIILIADRASEWREIVRQPPAAMRSDWTAVAALSAGIQDFTDFLRAFHNKILPDGTLDDRASPELSRIRREIEKQKRTDSGIPARLPAQTSRRRHRAG